MNENLDPSEVIKIAVSMEINGENHYRAAANLQTDNNLINLFNELADMEKDHARFFSSLLKDGHLNSEEIVEVEDEESAKKIADMISKQIFNQIPDNIDDMKEMFEYALKTEKLTIEFYESLKQVYPKLLGDRDINQIIEEEKEHLSAVQNAMGEYFYT